MKSFKIGLATFIIGFVFTLNLNAQNKGLKTISEKELRYHLEFLGAPEFRGRETPSPELEIATVYIGNWCKSIGLKPLMTDGTFYQTIPITVNKIVPYNTKLSINTDDGERIFYYGESFGGDFYNSSFSSGEAIFVGLGLVDDERSWNDLKDVDVYGKIVLILDEQHPDNKFELGATYSYRLSTRIREIRNRGAAAVLSIVDPEREMKKKNGHKIFEDIPSGRMATMYDSQRRGTQTMLNQTERPERPEMPFAQAAISQTVASIILGISEEQVADLFYRIRKGEQVATQYLKTQVSLNIETKKEDATTRNVIALVEGTDPKLKNEYIVISGHTDHLGISDGEIMPGADDNGTACVALMEIAQALLVDPPKRSVIFAWFTGEERGFIGSQYFVNNSVVPIEKINACLNMDMIGRNPADSLYLVGSNLLSSELDATIHNVNKFNGINFGFDYLYSNLTHPQRVYFRSDQYPHIRFGIPSVWFFSGFTHDYHTPNDITQNIDYKKVFKVTQLVYLTAYKIGNMKEMLKLDVNPEVTSRGAHNLNTRSLFENTK